MMCDGSISMDAFTQKEREYREDIIYVKSSMKEIELKSTYNLDSGLRILELAGQLYPMYLRVSLDKRAKMLRLLASNYTLTGTTVSAVYRKPFNYFVELAQRPVKLPELSGTQNF
jgi:hypothetical protein